MKVAVIFVVVVVMMVVVVAVVVIVVGPVLVVVVAVVAVAVMGCFGFDKPMKISLSPPVMRRGGWEGVERGCHGSPLSIAVVSNLFNRGVLEDVRRCVSG